MYRKFYFKVLVLTNKTRSKILHKRDENERVFMSRAYEIRS